MRTNIDIDDKLMAEAMEVLPAPTKKQAVEIALREAIQRRKAAKAVLALRGKIHWEGDLDTLRRS
jgi:Arc/MetJ family transcription regulator